MPFDTTDILAPIKGLAINAYDRLTNFFASTNHRPSHQQWAAIRDLMDHLNKAAQGQLDPALYLSPIPAGTGKSTSIAMFARTLMDSPDHRNAGMVIFVNRIMEARDMATMIGPEYRDKLSVVTSDASVNALGSHIEANDAQVSISTQEALKRTLKATVGASFTNASRFHYHGFRRAIVAWDEAFAFNRPVVLDGDTVAGLTKAMRSQSTEAASILKRWSSDVDTLTGLCTVPDFEGMGVDFSRLEDDVGGNDEMVSVAKALAVISGDEAFITRQGASAALVTHYPEIPASLMPVVVTDASAKVNPSYAQMARTRPVQWLIDAPKTYRNMTIRLVPTAASRSVYRDLKTTRGRDLLALSANYIESVPTGETVLVIGYKGWFRMKGVDETSLEDALRARLKPEDNDRTAYLAYGRHTATNAYKQVRHVLLMGLNFIPKAAGYAASGAALDLDLKGQHPTEDQVKTMQTGMLMDSTLQALLRGNARNGVDGDCGTMEAIIFQTRQTGISDDDYQRMFPEVRITTDTVLLPPKPLKGRLRELEGIVMRRLGAGEREMTNASLYGEMGMSERDFRALVKKQEWQARRAELGLNPQQLSGRMMGLRLVP